MAFTVPESPPPDDPARGGQADDTPCLRYIGILDLLIWGFYKAVDVQN